MSEQPQINMSVPPEEVARYRNEILREPLREASPLINAIWPDRPEAAAIGWQDISQKAIDAWSTRMFARMATVGNGNATPEVFASPDGREPLRWYLYGWIMGYARRGAGETCYEADVIDAASKLGTDISGSLAAVTQAHAVCAVSKKSDECASMAAGHVILSNLTKGGEPSYSPGDDAEGFADGWWQARTDGLGSDLWAESGEAIPKAGAGDTASLFPDAFMDAPAGFPSYGEESSLGADAGDTDSFFLGSLGLPTNDTFGLSSDDDFDEFSDSGGHEPLPAPTPENAPDATDGKKAPAPEDTGGNTVLLSVRREDEPVPQVPALMELPPKLRAHVKSCATMALRACRGILEELVTAGMSAEDANKMKEALSTATAKYAMSLLTVAGSSDGIPKEVGGAEPVLTYAHSWIHGYAAVMTDGEWSEHEITKRADRSTLSAADIDDDMSRIIDRCSWEGAPAECADVTVDHLIVVMTPHGRDFPLAHPLYSTRRYSVEGDADGFSDGWWKATYDMRREIDQANADEIRSMTADDAAAVPPSGGAVDEDGEKGEIGGGSPQGGSDPYVMSVVDELHNEDKLNAVAEEVVQSVSSIPMPFAAPAQEEEPPEEERRAPTPQERSDRQVADYLDKIAKRSSDAVDEVILHRSEKIKQFRRGLFMDGEATGQWIQGIASSTYDYATYLATVCHVNPLRTKDGTDPLLSYVDGMISGSMVGAIGRGIIDRVVMGYAAKYGISLSGPVLDRVDYVNNLCSMGNGFVKPSSDETVRRETNNYIRFQYVIHEAAKAGREQVFDSGRYNWRGDADGFMVGMRVGKRLMAQYEEQVSGRSGEGGN